MLSEYDKSVFEIVDLYDLRVRQCEQYRAEYDGCYERNDDDCMETPEEYRERVLGGLERGDGYVLTAYRGHAAAVVIPDGVTELGEYAFAENTELHSVYIPDSVSRVGGNAFDGCASLKSVRLSENIKSVGNATFRGCAALRSVTIPDGVEVLGVGAFDGCRALTDVTLGNGLKKICWDAFGRCGALKSVALPNELQEIEQNVFYDSALEEIRIPKSVRYIACGAFLHCAKLKTIEVARDNPYYYSVDNCIYYKKDRCLVVGRNDGRLPSDGSIVHILDDAFAGNASVKELTVPSGVVSIGAAAFKDCVNLRRVVFPESLESIERCAFEGCVTLEELVVPGNVKVIEGCAFRKSGIKRAVIKRGVETIDDDAFAECADLREIYIPSSVKQASYPLGCGSDEHVKALRVYMESSDENNPDGGIYGLDGFNVIRGCDSDIFD